MTIDIKPNNCISNHPCVICLADTWGLVCDDCHATAYCSPAPAFDACPECGERTAIHDHAGDCTLSEAFTSPQAFGSFIDARWNVTPEVRDRLAAQLGSLSVHEVMLRLVYQLTDDQDRSDAPGGKWGGAWVEKINEVGPGRVPLREVLDTADTATA